MEHNDAEIKSIEEMWQIIENFGIKREIYEMYNPGYHEVRNLYLIIIKERRKSVKDSK